jgi:hypothetical protein
MDPGGARKGTGSPVLTGLHLRDFRFHGVFMGMAIMPRREGKVFVFPENRTL